MPSRAVWRRIGLLGSQTRQSARARLTAASIPRLRGDCGAPGKRRNGHDGLAA